MFVSLGYSYMGISIMSLETMFTFSVDLVLPVVTCVCPCIKISTHCHSNHKHTTLQDKQNMWRFYDHSCVVLLDTQAVCEDKL